MGGAAKQRGRVTMHDKNVGEETWKIYLRSRTMRRKWRSKVGIAKEGEK